jgi:hypothetical protein
VTPERAEHRVLLPGAFFAAAQGRILWHHHLKEKILAVFSTILFLTTFTTINHSTSSYIALTKLKNSPGLIPVP